MPQPSGAAGLSIELPPALGYIPSDMGLFDRLSKEGREKSAVEKNLKRVLNKHAQSQDRFVAMEKLREIGTDEALLALARRFSYRYDKTIEDEQEKEWVYQTFVSLGERGVAPMAAYVRTAESISWPLRVLEHTAPQDRLLAIIDDLCAREEPGYTRDPSRKHQLLTWLGEWKGAPSSEIARRVVPYLADFDETIRFTAVDTLEHHLVEEVVKTPLLDALLRVDEESRRIKVRIAEILADVGWRVTERKDDLARLFARELPEFAVERDTVVRKK